jgi:hypothetical protein
MAQDQLQINEARGMMQDLEMEHAERDYDQNKRWATVLGVVGSGLVGWSLFSLLGYAGLALTAGLYLTLLWFMWTLATIIGNEMRLVRWRERRLEASKKRSLPALSATDGTMMSDPAVRQGSCVSI